MKIKNKNVKEELRNNISDIYGGIMGVKIGSTNKGNYFEILEERINELIEEIEKESIEKKEIENIINKIENGIKGIKFFFNGNADYICDIMENKIKKMKKVLDEYE